MKRAWAALTAGVALMLATGPVAGAGIRVDTPESLRAEAFEAAQWAIASDAADALAIAMCHARSATSLLRRKDPDVKETV